MTEDVRRSDFAQALAQAIARVDMSHREISDCLEEELQRGRPYATSSISDWKKGTSVPDADVVFALERCLRLRPGRLSYHLGYIPISYFAMREDGIRAQDGVFLDLSGLSDSKRLALLHFVETMVSED